MTQCSYVNDLASYFIVRFFSYLCNQHALHRPCQFRGVGHGAHYLAGGVMKNSIELYSTLWQ